MANGTARKKFAFVLGVVAAVLLAGVYVWQLRGQFSTPVPAPIAAAPAASAETAPALVRLLFQEGSDRLAPAAQDQLAGFAESARAAAGAIVEISAFHATGGDVARERELAGRRAQTVRHALESNGVAAARLRSGVGPAGEGATARVEVAIR